MPAFTRREEKNEPGIVIVKNGMDDLNEGQKEYAPLPLFAARCVGKFRACEDHRSRGSQKVSAINPRWHEQAPAPVRLIPRETLAERTSVQNPCQGSRHSHSNAEQKVTRLAIMAMNRLFSIPWLA